VSLSEVVNLSIIVTGSSLEAPGFGTPLVLVSKVPAGWGNAKVRTFGTLTELVDAGFTTSDVAYRLASRIKAQNPAIGNFKIALRDDPPVQELDLTCLTAVEGKTYSLEVGVNAGPTTAISYTVPGSATTSTVATAIAALINAVTGVTAAASVAVITVEPTAAGDLVNIKGWSSTFKLEDVTANPGVADELSACLVEDEGWYGVLLDSNSKAEVSAAAEWVEANKKLFAYDTSDSDAANGVAGNVFLTLKAAGYERSFGIYNGNETLGGSAAAWMGRGFAFDPGRITWAYKSLAGVSVDSLTAGQRAAIDGANGNFYSAVAGRNITRYGKVASGEFVEVTHFIDWLDAEMRLQVFAAISGLPKVPYTNAGLALIEGTIKAVLKSGVRAGGLADDENLFVRMPNLADIPESTRAARLVPDIEFGARLAGAIHKTTIVGTIGK
jgi:hypothetical protein